MRKKIISLTLALTTLFSLTAYSACKPNSSEVDEQQQNIVKETEYKLVLNSKTDYSIIIPENAESEVVMAASEIQYFARQSSGVEFIINAYQDDMKLSNGKYIVLGVDELIRDAKIDLNVFSGRNEGTYVLKSVEDDLFCVGADPAAVLYAAYDLLHYEFGYEFFYDDEILLNNQTTVPFYEFDVFSEPAFSKRGHSLNSEQTTKYRYRSHSLYDDWGLACHTYFYIVSPDKYWDEHKDWFSPAETKDKAINLCLSAGPEMEDEFFNNLVNNFIIKKPEAKYFNLGQLDNFTFCDCEKCTAAIAKKGTPSTLVVEFTNRMGRRLKEWLNANQPGREVILTAFAYNATLQPPTSLDENGEVRDKSYILEDNVGILFVPEGANYMWSFLDTEHNNRNATFFRTWKKLAGDNMFVWFYSCNFSSEQVPFPFWCSMQQTYADLAELGCEWVYNEGAHDMTSVGDFSILKCYVQSNIMWNPNQDMEALISKFINAYYKEAASDMQQVFNLYRDWANQKRHEGFSMYTYGAMNEKWWSKEFLYSMKRIFANAYSSIEGLKSSDTEKYDKIYNRVRREEITVDYMLLSLYRIDFGSRFEEEKAKLLYDATLCGISETKFKF